MPHFLTNKHVAVTIIAANAVTNVMIPADTTTPVTILASVVSDSVSRKRKASYFTMQIPSLSLMV